MAIDMSPLIGMFLKQVGWSKEKFEDFTGAIEQAIKTHADQQREILNTVHHIDFVVNTIMNEVCRAPLTGSVHQDYADAGFIQLSAHVNNVIDEIEALDKQIEEEVKK